MEIKFDVYFKKNLGTLFKSNEVDLDGIPAHTNLDLNLVDRLEANYRVGTQKYTDNVSIFRIKNSFIYYLIIVIFCKYCIIISCFNSYNIIL